MHIDKARTQATVSNALLSGILEGTPLPEEAKRSLAEQSGLSLCDLRDTQARSSIQALARLWNGIVRATGNDFIGLRIGQAVPAERFGLAVYAAQNSPDVRQALQRLVKYLCLLNDLIECELREADGQAQFSISFRWDMLELERHAVDLSFSCFAVWARRLLGRDFPVREIRLRHWLRAAEAEWRGLFGAPVRFGAPVNALVFDAALLDAAVADGNSQLGAILEHYASQELASTPVLADFPGRVSQVLLRRMQQGDATDLAAVCAELGLAQRQMQRILGASGTSFRLLLDHVRRTLAVRLLGAAGARVEQVGRQLGYSEPTAFIRVFRKWYGVTPGQYRQARQPP